MLFRLLPVLALLLMAGSLARATPWTGAIAWCGICSKLSRFGPGAPCWEVLALEGPMLLWACHQQLRLPAGSRNEGGATEGCVM